MPVFSRIEARTAVFWSSPNGCTMFFSTVLWLGLVPSKWHAVLYHCSRHTLRRVQVWTEERVHLLSKKKSSNKYWSWQLLPVSYKTCVWGIILLCLGGYHFPSHPRPRKLYLSLPSPVVNVFSEVYKNLKTVKCNDILSVFDSMSWTSLLAKM